MTYKITFCGSIETGKSTLINLLKEEIEHQNRSVDISYQQNIQSYDKYIKDMVQYQNELALSMLFTEQLASKFQNQSEFLISENSLFELIAESKVNLLNKDFTKQFEKLIFNSVVNYWDLIIYLPVKTDIQKKNNIVLLDYRKCIDTELKRILKEVKRNNSTTEILELTEVGFHVELAKIKQLLVDKKKLI